MGTATSSGYSLCITFSVLNPRVHYNHQRRLKKKQQQKFRCPGDTQANYGTSESEGIGPTIFKSLLHLSKVQPSLETRAFNSSPAKRRKHSSKKIVLVCKHVSSSYDAVSHNMKNFVNFCTYVLSLCLQRR